MCGAQTTIGNGLSEGKVVAAMVGCLLYERILYFGSSNSCYSCLDDKEDNAIENYGGSGMGQIL